MKILWFTNTACSADDLFNKKQLSGGWLKSLEQELNRTNNIHLAIGFYDKINNKPFTYLSTTYYPVKRNLSGNKLFRLISRIYDKNNDKREIKQLLKIVSDYKPDIIHIHGTEDNFGLIQDFVDIPVVVSIQGILSSIENKFFSGIPHKIIRKYEGLYKKVLFSGIDNSFKNLKYRSSRERSILKSALFVIGRTGFDKRVTKILSPKSKYFKLNEMLRSSFYDISKNEYKLGERIQIITILSDAVYKGLETIIQTAKILSEYNYKFTWNIVGIERNSRTVSIVEKWTKIKPANVNIKIIGKIDENELVKKLINSDVYCQVSHIENSPNALSEALILGLPAVATFAGGTETLVENNKSCILVQDGDYYSTAGAIIEIINNYKHIVEEAMKSKHKARINHNKENITRDLINIYKEINNNAKH